MKNKSMEKIFFLIKNKAFIKYAFNTSWLMLERILRLIAGLFIGIYVARYLGPEQYGLFSYALAFVSLFGAIAKLGLDGIVVRNLVQDPNQNVTELATSFWLKLFGAVLSIVAIAVAVQFTSNDASTNLFIFIIATGIIFQSFEVIDFYFQSKVLLKYVSISRILQLVISSLLKLYLIYIQADLLLFVLVTLIDHITLAAFLTFTYLQQKNTSFWGSLSFHKAKGLLSNSWPLIFSGLVLMIQARIDQVMLKEFIGSEEVGYYSVAMRLIEVYTAPIG